MYKKILVPLDGSKLAECVLPHLEVVVKGCEGAPEIILVQAVEPFVVPYGRELGEFASVEQLAAFEAHQKSEAEKYLKDMVIRLKKSGINARWETIYGKAGEALSDFVTKNKVDLVIIATHGRSGISRWVMGSVADRIMRSVAAPVLMVRTPGCSPSLQ